MLTTDYDRILKTAIREFERQVVPQVEAAFKDLPLDAIELPWIGDRFASYDRTVQKQKAIAALIAREWFKHEAGEWAQPLPLTFAACNALFNGPHQGNRRSRLVGGYGIALIERAWNLQYSPRFEDYCDGR